MAPQGTSYTVQIDLLILFWKSRSLPSKLIARLIYYHCGKVIQIGSIDARASSLRTRENGLGYGSFTDTSGYRWDAVDRWIRRLLWDQRGGIGGIDIEEVNRLVLVDDSVRTMLREVSILIFLCGGFNGAAYGFLNSTNRLGLISMVI